MINNNDYSTLINTLLKEGRSVEDIATDFTSALNAAVAEQKKIQEEKKREELQKEKEDSMMSITDDVIKYLTTFFPDVFNDVEFSEEDELEIARSLIRTFEESVPLLNDILSTLVSDSSKPKEEKNSDTEFPPKASAKNDDAILRDFLKQFSLF